MVGVCDVYIIDVLGLVVICVIFEDLVVYVVLLEIILKEFLGLLVCYGDDEWGDVVCWILNVLIVVEELGIILVNIVELLVVFVLNKEINCLLGIEGELGVMFGLDVDWVVKVILVGGNYGELFEKNIGENILIGLVCGLNV